MDRQFIVGMLIIAAVVSAFVGRDLSEILMAVAASGVTLAVCKVLFVL